MAGWLAVASCEGALTLGHEAEVQDDQAAVGSAQHVAWVRVRMEEACVQELGEVGDHAQVHQGAHVVGGGLRELLPIDPLGGMHSPKGNKVQQIDQR